MKRSNATILYAALGENAAAKSCRQLQPRTSSECLSAHPSQAFNGVLFLENNVTKLNLFCVVWR